MERVTLQRYDKKQDISLPIEQKTFRIDAKTQSIDYQFVLNR